MGEASLWGAILGGECTANGEDVWGWVVFPLLMLYAFYILAQLCDGHLTTALEFIVDRIKLSEDVAGATFLAMASSAPELFTSIIATCVLESSSGIGNILGSALFNLLVIIGVVPIFAGQTLKIWWYPTARDAVFYSIAILEIWLVMLDGLVYWWEGAIMTFSYFCYAAYFTQNERLIKRLGLEVPSSEPEESGISSEKVNKQVSECFAEVVTGKNTPDPHLSEHSHGDEAPEVTGREVNERRVSRIGSTTSRHSRTSKTSGGSGTDFAPRNSFTLRGHSKPKGPPAPTDSLKVFPDPWDYENGAHVSEMDGVVPSKESACKDPQHSQDVSDVFHKSEEPIAEEGEEDEQRFCKYEPIMILVDMTMPNRPEKLYTLFALCCLWIGLFTYVAVDSSSRLGCLMDLDDEVMGLVVLAAGTSVPDAMGSIAVAKDGMGDMAVANAVGSNTFDILLGLGLPWCIWGLVKGKPIEFGTEHTHFAIITLACCLTGYLALICSCRWLLTKRLGFLLLFSYVVVIVTILLRYYDTI